MIIVNSFRGLALILLIIILIIKEIPFKNLFKDLMIQFYMALTCILILLLVDNIFGFILSICLLTLYFRIYTNELNLINKNNECHSIKNKLGMEQELELEREQEQELEHYTITKPK